MTDPIRAADDFRRGQLNRLGQFVLNTGRLVAVADAWVPGELGGFSISVYSDRTLVARWYGPAAALATFAAGRHVWRRTLPDGDRYRATRRVRADTRVELTSERQVRGARDYWRWRPYDSTEAAVVLTPAEWEVVGTYAALCVAKNDALAAGGTSSGAST